MSANLGPIVPIKKWDAATFDTDYANPPRAIMIDAGVVVVRGTDDNPETLPLAAGIWHPMTVKRVVTTGTTAGSVFVGW